MEPALRFAGTGSDSIRTWKEFAHAGQKAAKAGAVIFNSGPHMKEEQIWPQPRSDNQVGSIQGPPDHALPSESPPGAAPGGIPDRPVVVLLVDHDSSDRSALAWLLNELGFHPIVAGDLATARKVLGKTTPQIMILNLMLPDGNAIDLLAEIRRAGRSITVAVMTAVTPELKLQELMPLKPDAIFGYPVDIDDFDDWLVKHLSNFRKHAAE
jgi:CheY-like chemotaxis protein